MTIQFGTDGWRAIIGDEFTFENVRKVARAYAEDLNEEHQGLPRNAIPIGFDRRFLSEEFAKAFAVVLASQGFKVRLAKTYCPTPCISWMTKQTQAAGGVMVTASHNPFQWNGIKFKESYGGSASPERTTRLEKRILEDKAPKSTPLTFEEAISNGSITLFDPQEDYVKQLRSQVDIERIQASHWKILYDPLFGAGSAYLSRVIGSEVEQIHAESNPGFGGLNPEPIDKNLRDLMKLVSERRSDVGLATDGDADRIGAVDEHGSFVNSHQIFALILNHLIEKGLRGDVIKTVSTTRMIDRIAKKHGLPVHETPIGFKHICGKFLEVKALMGGEESGGIGIPSHVYERDGLLCGLILLELMSLKKKRLGELLRDLRQEIGDFYFHREDLHLSTKEIESTSEKIKVLNPTTLAGLKILSTQKLDGTKFTFEDDSWLLLRPSGTEPLVRVYAESSTPERVQTLIQAGIKSV